MVVTSPTVLVHYITAALTLCFLTSRVTLSLWRREPIDISLVLVVTSILVMVARIVADVYYFQFGNASDVITDTASVDDSNPTNIKTGSILLLVARALITVFIWLQIAILLFFYTRITFCIEWVSRLIKLAWVVYISTFIGITLVTFLECRPFHLYWQLTPNPGTCVQAFGQLLAQTIANIVLDLMLIIIAWPIITLQKRNIGEYVTLYTMFTLGTFCIIISIVRIISVHDSGSSQQTRNLWASVQMMVSAFVANGPHVYGSIRVLWARRSTPKVTPHMPEFYLDPKERERRRRTLLAHSWPAASFHHHSIPLPRPLSRAYVLRPLAPATTLYDEETAPAPYSHSPSPSRFKWYRRGL